MKSTRHRKIHVKDYWPLLALVGTAALVASAATLPVASANGPGESAAWMHLFMGFFLCVFALVKLFDLPGFADGFQMYDLLAGPFRSYALVYPFIELALGLGYFAQQHLRVFYSATIVVLGFGLLGVARALVKGLDVHCACMGNLLKVPLSTVAVVENLGMVVMASAMLVAHG